MEIKKQTAIAISLCMLTIAFAPIALSAPLEANKITAGEVLYSSGHYLAGQAIPTGFDEYGYNYQGHMFVGSYFNVYSGGYGYPVYDGDDTAYLAANPSAANLWCWPYRNIRLIMKWNDAWISNKDAYLEDGVTLGLDGKLDRHPGYPSYIGSGAWETNHMFGTYEEDGKTYTWNSFVKIVAVPADAVLTAGYWYTPNGVEIGEAIWGEFAIIMDVENDHYAGINGLQYLSAFSAGFGAY